MTGLTLERLQAVLGGKIVRAEDGEAVRAPGPGHGPTDDSLLVRLDPSRDCGFRVQSFADDDQADAEDFVRGKLGQGPWKPNGRGGGQPRGKVVAHYVYRDERGEAVLRVTRREPKGFSQSRPDGDGGWTPGLDDRTRERLTPFRLPEMIEGIGLGRPVHVCEGEKAADVLIARGYTATCSPMGAGKWRSSYARWFQGADVVVLADNDPPGRKHAEQVAESLRPVAASVKIVCLPGLPPGGDVVDWIAAGNDPATIADMPDDDLAERPPEPEPPRRRGITAAELQNTEFAPIRFVIDRYLPEGLTIFAGKPKLGKSWLCYDICNAVARGGYTLGDIKCVEGDVLYCALEDGKRRTKKRMETVCSFGGWPKRLTFWYRDDLPSVDLGAEQALREWIASVPNPTLIVIDTLKFVRPKKTPHEDAYAYDARTIDPFKRLADEFGIAIIVVHHTRKMGADDPLELVSGTNGLTGAADTILVLDRTSSGCTLYARGRDIEEVETAVRFDRDFLRWSVLGDPAEVRRSAERKAILQVLGDTPAPLSPSEIALQARQKPDNVRFLLGKMVKAGEVEIAGYGKYALPGRNPAHSAHSAHSDDSAHSAHSAHSDDDDD
jgi:hypothetical protein